MLITAILKRTDRREGLNIPENEIPGILKSKLEACGIRTIDDLAKTTVLRMRGLTSFGKKSEEEFIKLRNRLIFKVDGDRSKPPLVRGPVPPALFIETVKACAEKYLQFRDDPKVSTIFEQRILTKKRTLEELGVLFDVERERIRQIEKRIRSDLSKLYQGEELKKVTFYLDDEVVRFLSELVGHIHAEQLVAMAELDGFLSERHGIVVGAEQHNYLITVLNLFEIVQVSLSETVFLASSTRIAKYAEVASAELLRFCLEKVDSVPIENALIATKRRLGKGSLGNAQVEKILRYHSSLVCNDGKCQVAFGEIRNLVDCAYRLLLEAGCPMHYQALIKETNYRRRQAGKAPLAPRTNAGLSTNDPRFSVHGRTGYWALSSWGKGLTVEEKIIKLIRDENGPVDRENLLSSISNEDLYGQSTVSSILSSMIGDSLEYCSKRDIILSDWVPVYGRYTMPKAGYNKSAFRREVERILSGNTFTARQIWEKTDGKTLFRLFQQRLEACPNIRISRSENLKYFSWQPKSNVRQPESRSKQQSCEDAIVGALSAHPDGQMEIPVLYEDYLKSRFKKPLMYKVISESSQIESTSQFGRKAKVIRLRSNSISPERHRVLSDKQIELARLLSSEESSTLEFKSTLRWDVQKSTLNKDLELMVLKTICAFANSNGGTLLIGVQDSGNVFGIESDYLTFGKKQNSDGFMLHLVNLIKSAIGETFLHTTVEPEVIRYQGRDICHIRVKKAAGIVFYRDKLNGRNIDRLFIRTGNSTTELVNPSEIMKFTAMRFGTNGLEGTLTT